MTIRFRTLLLLGFTALTASLSGCFVETTSGNGGSSCSTQRYFEVQWLADNGVGTAPLTCGSLSFGTSVGLVLGSGVSYVVDGACNDQYKYNFDGYTQAGVGTGDYVSSFSLLRTDTHAVISPGGTLPGPSVQNPAMPSCSSVVLTYEFPLM
jgi:hypothetical protein